MRSLALRVNRSACVQTRVSPKILGWGLVALLVCLPLFSQTNTGRVLGSVTDQTGAALSGATVVITDVQRGVTRTVTTDEAGAYVAPDLFPGIYTIRGRG